MWSLLLDFLASMAVEWRIWKWIHDPPLKGDRPQSGKQHPLVKVVLAAFLFIFGVLFIVLASAFLLMLGQGIYWVVTEGVD